MYGTTLTSPTVYVSLDSLWGLNSCSKVGTPMTNVIVPITNTETLSSMYGWGRYLPAYGASASFNFTPRCAFASYWHKEACDRNPNSTLCDVVYPCARTLPYEPVLSVPGEVLGLQPEWADCIGGLNGIYDPPLALQEAASAALPEFPTAANGGSSSARTTHQSESSPDATTPAAPSPTMSQIVSATNPPPSPNQSQATVPNEPTQTSASNDNSGPQTPDTPTDDEQLVQASNDRQTVPSPDTLASNALDVLIQAASNAQASNVPNDGSGQTPNGDAASPQQTQGSNGPAPVADVALRPATTWTASDGSAVSAHQDGNNVIIAASGNTVMVSSKGDPVSFAGQIISQDGSNNLIVDGSSVAVPAAAITHPASPAAVWTAQNGNIISAVIQGSAFVIGDSQSSVTVAAGATVVFNGQTINAAVGGGALVIEGSSLPVEQPGFLAANPAAVATASNGDVLSAIAQGSNIVVHDGQTAVTIAPGSSTVVGGQTIAVAGDGNAILAGGSTIAVHSATGVGNLWTALDGQVFSVTTKSNEDIELIGQSTTLTLTPGGSPTVVDGQTFSALPNGGGIVVDGSSIAIASGEATWTAPGGSTITATPEGDDDVVFVDDGRTITLDANDSSTVLDDYTVSVLAGGSAFAIDGTTVSVSRTSSGASRTTSGAPRTTTDEGDSTQAAKSNPTSTQGRQETAAAPTSESSASNREGIMPWDSSKLLNMVALLILVWL
ncbi:hypothetical protein PRZ48_011684 [Zasmidium cellare]|uniref:Uncharacterized protein n=1 Tax=Zasmidium cellare TaxID=395010 RepID=A0ABR0E7D6_ZASCE|nr:hypothetical protein PRZ48_011684 [Zasmidium cellare]